MLNDDTVARALDEVMPYRLHELSEATGLPVVFGGPTRALRDGSQLTISRQLGTLGDSLRMVSVHAGRGLGGAAMARRTPCRVSDYATTIGITHDYDHVVVDCEKITAMLAYPIVLYGAVRGVVYGALRENRPIGDVAVRNAGVVAESISRDAALLLERRCPPALDDPRSAAIGDLTLLIDSTTDPRLRDRLVRIRDGLTGARPAHLGRTGDGRPTLSPRELEAMRHVAVGASNAEIADELGVTLGTVKAYLYSAMRKLDAPNRGRAVVAARAAGLL